MASSIKARPQEEEAPEKGVPETAPDSPLLDLPNAAVKKLIRFAKKRGYVTHDQINSVLPSEEVNSEQIEDVLAMFRGDPGDEQRGSGAERRRRAARGGRRRGRERERRIGRGPAEGPG